MTGSPRASAPSRIIRVRLTARAGGYAVSSARAGIPGDAEGEQARTMSLSLEERFQALSRESTNACGLQPEAISGLDVERLQGSCCGPMVLHRYEEQVAGLLEQCGKGVRSCLVTTGARFDRASGRIRPPDRSPAAA